MIYTLTFAPSIDYVIEGQEFTLHKVNRFNHFQLLPGGKGVNASVVLTRLGFKNKAISFFDQATLNSIQHLIAQENLDFINIASQARTRINVKFYGTNTEFELNGPKMPLTEQQWQMLEAKLQQLTNDDLLIIMGLSETPVLIKILEILKQRQTAFILDVDSSDFRNFLAYQPFLIKPNKDELEKNFNMTINSEADVIMALQMLQRHGAQNVIISFDSHGSYLLTAAGEIYKALITKPLAKVVSATGAGDTLISTFGAYYWTKQKTAAEALQIASAAAMGTVAQMWLTTAELTQKYFNHIAITAIHKEGNDEK
ncbi:1-phosphofructokinase [Candidatus Mycoplasma pogonae]